MIYIDEDDDNLYFCVECDVIFYSDDCEYDEEDGLPICPYCNTKIGL